MERHILLELTDKIVRYKYFPEGNEAVFGVVSVNRKTGEKLFEKLAAGYDSSYANHACLAIRQYIEKNVFPKQGMSAWY